MPRQRNAIQPLVAQLRALSTPHEKARFYYGHHPTFDKASWDDLKSSDAIGLLVAMATSNAIDIVRDLRHVSTTPFLTIEQLRARLHLRNQL